MFFSFSRQLGYLSLTGIAIDSATFGRGGLTKIWKSDVVCSGNEGGGGEGYDDEEEGGAGGGGEGEGNRNKMRECSFQRSMGLR